MPRQPSYTAEDVDRIKRLLMQGRSVQEIADRTGFTPKVIASALMKHEGLSVRQFRARCCPARCANENLAKFKSMLLAGRSTEEIGKATGFTEGQIRYAIKQA